MQDDGVWSVEEAHADAIARGARCRECPLYGCDRGPVMGEIRPNSTAIVIAEAPGPQEVRRGYPMAGYSGTQLEDGLQRGGLSRQEVSVTNTLLCLAPTELNKYLDTLRAPWKAAVEREREAAKKEKRRPNLPKAPITPIECCKPRLERDIKESGATSIIALGGHALRHSAERAGLRYAGKKTAAGEPVVATIMDQHGSPIEVPKIGWNVRDTRAPDDKIKFILPSLHPAFGNRTKNYKHVIRDDIARAAEIALSGEIGWSWPEFILDPDIDTVEAVCRQYVKFAGQPGCEVACDIETDAKEWWRARVRLVQFHAKLPENPFTDSDELVIAVPFLWRDGRSCWSDRETKQRAWDAVRLVIDRCAIVGQNFYAYDIPVLARHGAITERGMLCRDLMLAHKNTIECDLPHGLGFITKRCFPVPLWKSNVDHKVSDNADSDRDYRIYGCEDATATGRAWSIMKERVKDGGFEKQFRIDSRKGPAISQMCEMGMIINERDRGRYAALYHKIAGALSRLFVQEAGVDINPNSSDQVKTWLYKDLGYEPPLNTEGRPWKPGDAASAGTAAIMQLQDLGVEPHVDRALDWLIQYKSCVKLTSSYIDKSDDIEYDYHPDLVDAGGFVPAVHGEILTGKDRGSHGLILPQRPLLSWLPFSYHQRPATGRLGSERNVQNIIANAFAPFVFDDNDEIVWKDTPAGPKPKRRKPTNLRTMIVAPPDHCIVRADMAQIELRIFAEVAQDQVLLDAFRAGHDPHLLNFCTLKTRNIDDAYKLYHELFPHSEKGGGRGPKAKRIKFYRTIAKRFIYLMIYGGEEGKLYQTMKAERNKATGERTFASILPSDVEEWYDNCLRTHPEIRMFQHEADREVAELGCVWDAYGVRARAFPGGATKKNAPRNAKIQPTAATVMDEGMLRLIEEIPFRSWTKWTGAFLQVHDELGLYAPVSRVDEAKAILKKCMDNQLGSMPLPADPPEAFWAWS